MKDIIKKVKLKYKLGFNIKEIFIDTKEELKDENK
jgi:hypothetical protein